MAFKNLSPLRTIRLPAVVAALWWMGWVLALGAASAGCNEERFEGRGGCETDADCLAPRLCVDSWCVGTVIPDTSGDTAGDISQDPGQDPSEDPGQDPGGDPVQDPGGDPVQDPGGDPVQDPDPDVPLDTCLEIDPNPLVFPSVAVRESATALVRVTNCGEGPVTITDAFVISPRAVEFGLLPPPATPVTLVAGESFGLLVSATGVLLGDWDGQLLLNTTAIAEPIAVTLRARVTDGVVVETPCLQVQPVVDFGVLPANVSIANTFEVFNCGDVVLRIEDIEVPDPFVLDDIPDSLLPGQRSQLRAAVIPQPAGSYQAEVTVRASEGLSGTSIFFVRFADAPPPVSCLVAEPSLLTLGPVPLAFEAVGLVEVRNCGETTLALQPPQIRSGSSASFRTEGARRVLAPGESVTYPVAATGADLGSFSATWRVEEASGLAAPAAVAVRLDVVDTIEQPLCLALEPNPLFLGAVPLGDVASRTVLARNCGDLPLRLDNFTLEGSEFFSLDAPRAALAPGASAPISVTFVARTPGDAEAVARFFGPDGTLAAELELQALAVEEVPEDCLTFGTAVLTLPAVEVGTLVSRPVNLINCGTRDVVVQRLFASASELFTFLPAEPLPVVLPPGGSLRVAVRFRPPSVGEFRDRLVAESTRGNIATIQIVGTGRTIDAPCAEAIPEEVNVGGVPLGEVVPVRVRIRNCGTTSWTWQRDNLVGSGAFSVRASPLGQTITPGSEATATLTFAPTAVGPQRATLEVTTNPTVFVQAFLVGEGTEPSRGPILEVRPTTLNFGELSGGEFARRTLELCNTGDAPLTLGTVDLSGDAFFDVGLVPGLTIPAGVCQVADVVFAPPAVPPGAATTFRAVLRIVGEPGAGTATVTLLGSTSTDPPPPCPVFTPGVAREAAGPYAASLDVPRGASIFLDAGAPRGTTFEAIWSNPERPGAPVVLTPTAVPGRVSATLSTDGNYTFVVQWRTPEGCGASQEVRVSVRGTGVGEGLRLVLTWSTPGDPDQFTDPGSDVDLHLARRGPGGVWGWNSQNDCYYANRTPTWSNPGPQDDPRLLRDETNGLGPEILVLEQPSEDAYAVAIHYFSDSGFGASTATLRVFWDGLQIASANRQLRGTGEVWIAGIVRDNGRRFQTLDLGNFGGFPGTFPF